MKNEFLKRAISGLIFAIAIISFIYYSSNSYILMLGVLMIFGLYEFSKMALSDDLERFGIMYPISISVFLYGVGYYREVLSLVILVLVFVVFIIELRKKEPNPYRNLGSLFLGVIYISTPIILAAKIPFFKGEYHPEIMLSIFILIWANDSFAYIIGRKFGKTKLIERISPKKTVEGFIGGLVLTYVVGGVLSFYHEVFSLLDWFVITNIVGVFGVLGDLVESMFKRKVKVKDSGKFMPGHGGVLDRFDSFLFITPFVYIYIQIIQL